MPYFSLHCSNLLNTSLSWNLYTILPFPSLSKEKRSCSTPSGLSQTCLTLAWTHPTFSSMNYLALHRLFLSYTKLSCSAYQFCVSSNSCLSHRPWIKLWCLLFNRKMMAVTQHTASVLALAENLWIWGWYLSKFNKDLFFIVDLQTAMLFLFN